MTENTDVSIKELADKLGISKQAVRRYFDQLPPSLTPIKKGGAYRISSEAQDFISNKVDRVGTNIDKKVDINKIDVDTFQNEVIQLFQKEYIDDKNEQIKSLKKQVERLHTLLDQQQQLTLQSNKQIDKLQLQLELNENNDPNLDSLDISMSNQQIAQLISELEQKNKKNEQLQNELFELKSATKKSIWQRLFHS